MAEKSAIFTLKVDTGNSVNDINNFDKSLQGLNNDINATQQNLTDTTATDAFAQKLQDLNAKVDAGGLTMRELGKVVREYQSIAMATGETSPVGSEALLKASKLTDKMGDIRKQTTALSSDYVKLDTAIQGIETGTAVFQGVQSAIALTGVENEKLMQTMVKLQAVQGVANSVNTIAKNLNSESVLGLQLKTTWEKIYAGAVGNSTGAMKGLRVAMLSTGIGALIVGIGALIANWEKLKNSISNQTATQKLSNQVMKTATAQIANELSASDKLSRQLRDETLTRQQKIQKVKEFQAAYPGLLKNVNLETMSIAQINGQLIKNIELLKLQAQAKAIEAVRAEKLQEILTTQLDIQAEAQENAGNFTIDLGSNAKNGWIGYSTGAENANLATKDFTKIQTDGIKQLKTQIGSLDKASDAIDKQILALKSQGAQVETGTDKIVDYSKQTKSFTTSTNDNTDAVEKQNKINERKAEILDDIRQAEQEYADSQLTQQEKEIAEVQRKYSTLIAEANEYNSLLTEAEKEKAININQLQIAQMNAENDINLKYQNEAYAKAKADEEKKLKDIAEAEKKKLDLIQQYRAIVEDEYQAEITAFEKAQEEKAKALNENLSAGNITQEEYMKAMLKLEEDYDKKIVEVNKKKNKDIADAEKKTFDEQLKSANDIIEAVQRRLDQLKQINDTIKMFEQIRLDESRQIAEQKTLILDEQMKKELDNQNLTEEQKTAIQESYGKKKYEIQLKQFKEDEKIKKSQFQRDKALRIAQVAIDTASAITKGIAEFGPPPSPLGIASIAMASGIGIAQATAIAKQQFQGGSAPSAPNISAGGGMGASSFQIGTNTQQTTTPTTTQTTSTSTTPISVVVVESDITSVQNKVKAQEVKSNFG